MITIWYFFQTAENKEKKFYHRNSAYCVTPPNGKKKKKKKTQTQLENFYSKKLQSHVKFWSSSSAWNQDELACLLRWDAL